MPFALTPDGGYPRLVRFCALEEPYVSALCSVSNLLLVDRAKYHTLTKSQQEEVLRTHANTLRLFNGKLL
jgi:hypothetical protein